MAINIDVNVDAQKAKREVTSFTDRAKSQFKALGGIITTVSVAAIGAFIKNTIDATDKIGKMSIRLGESVEFLSKMGFVAERSGVRVETMQIAIQRANRRLAEFATTGRGTAMGAIKQLGIEVKNTDGSIKSFEEILPELTEKLGGVSSQSEKLRLAFQLFDSEGVSFLQIMDGGVDGLKKMMGEAKRFGEVITQDMADKAAAANDAIRNMTGALSSLGREAAVTVAPGLTAVSNWLADIISKTREKGWSSGFVEFMKLFDVQSFAISMAMKSATGATDKQKKSTADLAAEQEKFNKLARSATAAKAGYQKALAEEKRLDDAIAAAQEKSNDLDRIGLETAPDRSDAEHAIWQEKFNQASIAFDNAIADQVAIDDAEKKQRVEQMITAEKETQLAYQNQVSSAISPFAQQLASAVVDARDLNEELKIMAKQLAKRVFAGIITGAVGSLFGVPFGAGFKAGSGFGGFASGGSFVVPGSASAFDTQNVSFRARPGETVTVTPKGQSQSKQAVFNISIAAQKVDRFFVESELIPMLTKAQARLA